MSDPRGTGRSTHSLERQIRALADSQGTALSDDSLRAVAGTLAGALDALHEAVDELDCSRTPPGMRPALYDEVDSAAAVDRL